MKHRAMCSIWLLVLIVCVGASRPSAPRNIIVMIGDGMGVAQLTAGRTYKGHLALEHFKTTGLVLTHAYGTDYITDSAASASAIATGVSTYNGAISVGPDTTARRTVLEKAQSAGKKTGIVTTCSVTHATPACFVAHVPSRRMELEIAEQISRGETSLYLASGWGWFLPDSLGGRRTDGQNLIETMQDRGYSYVSTDSAFRELDLEESKKVLGLFAENHVGWAQDRRPSLKTMTLAALHYLARSRQGFFLLIEGSQIDWASHRNEEGQMEIEMADFDDAVGEVVRFAMKHRDTLVIVTADHETGGYALVDGSLEDHTVTGKFASDRHTGTMVPLFAMGPGSERFGGIRTHADVGKQLLELLR